MTSEQSAKVQNDFYNPGYKRRLTLLMAMALLNITLSGLVYYFGTHRPNPDFFMVTSEGKAEKLYALDQPVVTTRELLMWSTVTATTVNTYNFVNWRNVLEESSKNYTPVGWSEFQKALEGNLNTVLTKKLSVSAVATGAPIITEKGLLNGVYKWRVQLPLLLTYESASANVSQPVVVTMLITRTSTADTPRGIAIESFYMVDKSISPKPVNK